MASNLPAVGEIVVCRITKILNYGVFTELLEYEGLQGFVHIAQVSSSWVKNIRNFAKEGQIRVAQVINVDSAKNQIDLSFNKVSAGMQHTRIEEWKQLKRSQKLIELVAKKKGESFEAAWNEIAEPLLQKYDSLYDAFNSILIQGKEAAEGVPQKWVAPLTEVISKNVEIPQKTVKGTLTLSSTAPDGIMAIKKALLKARESAKGAMLDIYYAGSAKYVVSATSSDYKAAEKALRETAETAIGVIEAEGGSGKFEKTAQVK